MAEVYLARDTRLGRKVALKVVQPEALGSEQSIERFQFEARATARFNHPNIVTIHFVGEVDGKPYVALEHVEGDTLRQRVEQGPLAIAEVIRVGRSIVGALVEAHRAGIIHRDLKPENVMLGHDGRLRVMDFGLARRCAAAAEEASAQPAAESNAPGEAFVSQGGIRGTPAYMAPEQWNDQEITEATDIWALGVMLYELAAGRRPFEAPTPFRLALAVCRDAPVPPLVQLRPDAPQGLAGLVHRCLDRDATRRPRAREVAGELERMLTSGRTPRGDECPFRGLLPFGEQHADLFFGREAEVTSFVEQLRQEPVIPVVGPSGAGKSSFVQAGVLPRLREQGLRRVLLLRPGRTPFENLARRLLEARAEVRAPSGMQADGITDLAGQLRDAPEISALLLEGLARATGGQVLLVVDQLEEIFTLTVDPATQRAFVQAVYGAADDADSAARVVLTMREEFLGRLAAALDPGQSLGRVTVLRRPGPDTLEQILIRQASAAGYSFEDETLTGEMVAEIEGEAACLPLLQFAAQRLWDSRDEARRLLRRRSYAQMGGVAGALAQHADGVLAGMSAEDGRHARTVLLRLVTAEGTRRVLTREQALEGLDLGARDVLSQLVEARLVTAKQSAGTGAADQEHAQVELVHEALITSWARLRRWIEETHEELAFLEELDQAADLWDRRGRPRDEVWDGAALADARRKVASLTTSKLTGRVGRFLEASERKDRARILRRRGLLAGGFAMLAALALVFFVKERETAEQHRIAERRRAEAQIQRGRAEQQRAEAQRGAALAALQANDLLAARSRLRSALETHDSVVSRMLWRRLARDPRIWTRRVGKTTWGVAVSPDGRTVAAVSGKSVHLLAADTGETRRVLRGHRGGVFSVAFSPDGRLLASSSQDGDVRIWRVNNGDTLRRLTGHEPMASDVCFSPDGRLLVSSVATAATRLWEVGTGRLVKVFEAHSSRPGFSPDGQLLAMARIGGEGTISLWDVKRGRWLKDLGRHGAQIWPLRFSPDGRLLATGGEDGTIKLWDVGGGTRTAMLAGHSSVVTDLRFSPDGRWLVSASYDQTVRLWDVQSGTALQVLRGPVHPFINVAVSADGRRVAAASFDGTVRLWNPHATGLPAYPGGHHDGANGVACSPNGALVASGGNDRLIRLRDGRTGLVRRVLAGHRDAVHRLAFSPDGRLLASASADRTLRLWDASSGLERRVLWGHGAALWALRFSPDGKLVASGGEDRSIRLWRVRDGTPVRVLDGHQSWVISLDFDRTGRTLVSGGNDGVLRLWDVRSGARKAVLSAGENQIHAVSFSPDGRAVAAGSVDGLLRLWDLRSRRGRVVARFSSQIEELAFHPGGERIAAALSDGTVRILELSGRPAATLLGHRSAVTGVCFTADGETVATASFDGTARLWHAATGRPRWRGPALLAAPPELFSHRGWRALSGTTQGASRQGRTWREAIAREARLVDHEPSARRLCLQSWTGRLELWDSAADRRLLQRASARVRRLIATPRGCFALTDSGAVWLHLPDQEPLRLVKETASAIATHGTLLHVARGKEILRFDLTGNPIGGHLRTQGAVTALLPSNDRVLVGYRDGGVGRAVPQGRVPARLSLQGLPAASVERLAQGPPGTLAAGFTDGTLALWHLKTGALLDRRGLHGPVVHLLVEDNRLIAATELGDHVVWDLAVLRQSRCDLLQAVWAEIPTVWDGGKAVLRPPPRGTCPTGQRWGLPVPGGEHVP